MIVLAAMLLIFALYMVATLYAAIGALLFVAAMRDLPAGTWRQKHHAYWGAILYVACSVGIWWSPVVALWVYALLVLGASIGAAVLSDDGKQHAMQVVTGNLSYESPLKRWFYRTFPSLARY